MNQKNKRGCKRGQVAIFVIIAIAIAGILLIVFLPNLKTIITGPVPDVELSGCLQENVRYALNLALLHGGIISPELYYVYQGEEIEYLCYTRDYYKTCIMQKPLLKQTVESEVEKYIQPAVKGCTEDLIKKLKSRGYNVESKGANSVNVQIIPKRVAVSLVFSLKVEKDGKEKIYEKFNTDIGSQSYDLIMIASSIMNWEAHYGDSVPETYMAFYPNIKVEKKKQSDGTTIYIITNRETGEKLQFASRSLAWPAGYAA